MTTLRHLTNLVVVLVALMVLCSCSFFDSDNQKTKLLGHELYLQALSPQTMIVPDAIRYLRRRALIVESDAIRPGIYSLSAAVSMAHKACNPLDPLNALARAASSGSLSSFKQRVEYDPLASMPAELTALESLNRQYRSAQTNPFGISPHDTIPIDRDLCRVGACTRYIEERACEEDYGAATDGTNVDVEIFDLDYLVQVSATKQVSCCSLNNRTANRTTRDPFTLAAEAEAEKRNLDLASVTYSDDDIFRLIRLLPIKYRGKSDEELALPDVLAETIAAQFSQVASKVQRSFIAKTPPQVQLTYKQSDILESNRVQYGAWFQALSHPAGRVYVSPLLARAPFFVCFNHGARDYLEAVWNLRKQLASSSEGWRMLGEGDIVAVGKLHHAFDDEYRACVNSQLFFIFAHELGHIVGIQDTQIGNVSEQQADCFAFISTQRDTKFDLGVFKQLVLGGKESNNKETNDLVESRLANLARLKLHFGSAVYPVSGEDTVEFCSDFTRSIPKVVLTAGQFEPVKPYR